MTNKGNIFYVYSLINPITSKIFYIGRGVGLHVDDYYRVDPNLNRHTSIKIDEIRADGHAVVSSLIKANLSEAAANELEEALIKKHGRIGKEIGGILTNDRAVEFRSNRGGRKVIYSSIQLRKDIKTQISNYCENKGLKVGRFLETLFINAVSGSAIRN